MDLFKEFVASPSLELLERLKVEELWRVVTHYSLTPDVMQGRSKKKEVFAAVHMGLIDQGVLEDDETSSPGGSPSKGAGAGFVSVGTGLSFAEQKELLAMPVFPPALCC